MKCLAYFGPLRCKCHKEEFYSCNLQENHVGAHRADQKHNGTNIPIHSFEWLDIPEYKR